LLSIRTVAGYSELIGTEWFWLRDSLKLFVKTKFGCGGWI
jgi:hypothetical protein